jgi:hypothetical protein
MTTTVNATVTARPVDQATFISGATAFLAQILSGICQDTKAVRVRGTRVDGKIDLSAVVGPADLSAMKDQDSESSLQQLVMRAAALRGIDANIVLFHFDEDATFSRAEPPGVIPSTSPWGD